MTNKDKYFEMLILRAMDSALLTYGEKYLRDNPGVLLLEIELLQNLDLFTSSNDIKKFKPYDHSKLDKKLAVKMDIK